jgi:hypothetical protein
VDRHQNSSIALSALEQNKCSGSSMEKSWKTLSQTQGTNHTTPKRQLFQQLPFLNEFDIVLVFIVFVILVV